MAVAASGGGQQPAGILKSSQSCRNRKVHAGPTPNQCADGFKPTLQGGVNRGVWLGSVIAEKVDERNLHATFTRYTAGHNQRECFIEGGLFHTGVENNPGHLNDVVRQLA